jgi:glycosyltransferase involved in cell wall biosynthesis
MQEDKLISVVVPLLNETKVLDMFFGRLLPALRKLGMRYEVVCVDNGSRDDTLLKLLTWREKDTSVKVIALSRYFGKEAALSAGLDRTSGDAVVMMDPDLQDPPELLAEFLAKWREGFEIVYATRRSSGIETWFRRAANAMFYRMFNFVCEIPIPRFTGDFRLIDRRVVEIVRGMRERARFLRALTTWVGFRSTPVFFDRPPRPIGESKSNSLFLWRYGLDAIMSSTTRPLRIWTYVGFGISTLALLAGMVLCVRTLLFGRDVPGFASMMTTVLFLGGIQLISIGVVAEYVGRIYREVQDRPLYIVDKVFGLEDGKPRIR